MDTLFPWMASLMAQVPDDWAPELKPAEPEERVLGMVPSQLYKVFVTTWWARQEAERIVKDHFAVCDGTLKFCKETTEKERRLKTRGAVLGTSFIEAMRDIHGLSALDKIAVRQEGVVLIPPQRTTIDDVLEEMTKSLANSGGRVRVVSMGRGGFRVHGTGDEDDNHNRDN